MARALISVSLSKKEFKMAKTILMIDDKVKNLDATKIFLEAHGIGVETMSSPIAALERLKTEEFPLVLLDVDMPEMDGQQALVQIRKINPLQQVAMFSCVDSRDTLKFCYETGAVKFIEKSTPPEELLALVNTFCLRYEEACATIRKERSPNFVSQLLSSIGMVGKSDVMGRIGQKVLKLGQAGDVTVFISGESGTGKELVAQALHKASDRAKGPFIAVNCAAIPRELIESELFGHVKGAFTGAINAKDGKFVLADGGTIFLDEIADLPLDLQAKLLRVLQERTVEPVGGGRFSKKIDVRVISASHKNLDACVKAGTFREDLKYRVVVSDIHLPPLRERTEDIEPLIAHFTEVHGRRNGRSCRFQRQTLKILKRYPWPGNVRELSSVVQRHMIEASGPLITPSDLDLKLYQSIAGHSHVTLEEFDNQQSAEKLRFLEDVVEAAGSKAEAARRLGISAAHLQYLVGPSKAAKQKERSAAAQ
jgi:two-component system, NtrC family, response regulator AtoC